MLELAAQTLEKRKDSIAAAASDTIFRELSSYHSGQLSPEESRHTVVRIIDFIIENLRQESGTQTVADGILSTFATFEQGIAARRVHYNISIIDLLNGVGILRDQLWRALRDDLGGNGSNGGDFFSLERRVNAVLDHFFVNISDAYLKNQEQIVAQQAEALEQWEEVVKSASSIQLKIPCSGEYVSIVRMQAEAIARRVDYAEEDIDDIRVAVGEACDNSIEHGVSDKGVDVHYHLTADSFKVEVTDYGRGFDPSQHGGEEAPDVFAERGRGIFLMKALMNDVSITSSAAGTHVVLTKKRPVLLSRS